MVEVRRVGSVLETDHAGYLIPATSNDKIIPPWSQAVDQLGDSLSGHLGEFLHSGYVRGSVAAGTAIEGVSDLDGVAVLQGSHKAPDPGRISIIEDEVGAGFPFCRGVEILVLTHDQVMAKGGLNRWGFLLGTQSVNVCGENLLGSLPRYRLGPLAVIHAPGLKEDLDRVLRAIENEPSAFEREQWCAWVMRRIVRTGFEVVMDQEAFWTRDLYVSWEAFASHYPEHREKLREALELAVNPTADTSVVSRVVAGIGSWVAERGFELYGVPPDSPDGGKSTSGR